MKLKAKVIIEQPRGEYDAIREQLREQRQLQKSKIVRDILIEKGYDAFVYKNISKDEHDNHPGICLFNLDKIKNFTEVDKLHIITYKRT